MIEVCRDKFSVGISGGYVELVNGNFFDMDIPDNQSLVLSILSMQFMPTAYRQNMINSIYEALNPGGAFVFVEKIIADEGTDDLNVDLYYQMKRENGYTEEKIMQKRKSLENVLSPLKAEWNEDMLHEAGFEKVDMFWRCLNFVGGLLSSRVAGHAKGGRLICPKTKKKYGNASRENPRRLSRHSEPIVI